MLDITHYQQRLEERSRQLEETKERAKRACSDICGEGNYDLTIYIMIHKTIIWHLGHHMSIMTCVSWSWFVYSLKFQNHKEIYLFKLFYVTDLFCYPLKTLEKLLFYIFRGYRKRSVEWNELLRWMEYWPIMVIKCFLSINLDRCLPPVFFHQFEYYVITQGKWLIYEAGFMFCSSIKMAEFLLM